jgi:hypothetical protein
VVGLTRIKVTFVQKALRQTPEYQISLISVQYSDDTA